MLRRLGLCLEERFLVEAFVERTLAVSLSEINRERDQFFFNTLASRVAAAHPHTEDAILGVTEFDLYRTSQRFVFSGVSDDKRSALVSTARLHSDNDAQDGGNMLFQRTLKQATHAVGRFFGLNPCHTERCVMAVATTVYDIDASDSHLCESCARRNATRQQSS
jgi:archaemetzincin